MIQVNERHLGLEKRVRYREVKRDVFVCVESGYLFGRSQVVQVRAGFSDLDGKAKQTPHRKALKRKGASL